MLYKSIAAAALVASANAYTVVPRAGDVSMRLGVQRWSQTSSDFRYGVGPVTSGMAVGCSGGIEAAPYANRKGYGQKLPESQEPQTMEAALSTPKPVPQPAPAPKYGLSDVQKKYQATPSATGNADNRSGDDFRFGRGTVESGMVVGCAGGIHAGLYKKGAGYSGPW